MDISILEIAIVIAVLVVVFVVLMKYFKWAIEGVFLVILAIIVLYLALRVLNYGDASGAIKDMLEQVKEILGFNDPKTQADVNQLKDSVVETTNADTFFSRFNLKEIWENIKELLSF